MILQRTKRFLENHFETCLVVGFLVGLLLPGLKAIPTFVPTMFVGMIIFTSISRIEPHAIREINIFSLGKFYLARFIILPLFLYHICGWFWPSLSSGVLLLSAVPAGVTSVGLATILRGNIALSLALVIVSSFAAPLVVPALFAVCVGHELSIDISGILKTIALVIFLPIIVDRIVNATRPKLRDQIKENSSALSVALMTGIAIMVTGQQQQFILSNPSEILRMLPLLLILYFCFYSFAWLLSKAEKSTVQISIIICSGANNNALAIGLAVLYFPSEIMLFTVLSEVPWTLGVIFLKKFYYREIRNAQVS